MCLLLLTTVTFLRAMELSQDDLSEIMVKKRQNIINDFRVLYNRIYSPIRAWGENNIRNGAMDLRMVRIRLIDKAMQDAYIGMCNECESKEKSIYDCNYKSTTTDDAQLVDRKYVRNKLKSLYYEYVRLQGLSTAVFSPFIIKMYDYNIIRIMKLAGEMRADDHRIAKMMKKSNPDDLIYVDVEEPGK